MLVSFSVVSAVGLSNLSVVNMAIPRNQLIIGFSLLMGIMLPIYMKDPNVSIHTGMSNCILQYDYLILQIVYICR